MSARHRVVIVGGGFGGLHAALALAHLPVDVALIDRRNFHLFQPLLYQVATGGLSPADICAPLRGILRHAPNVRVLLGEVTAIDPDRKEVTAGGQSYAYDTLVLAAGAANFYFGHDEWAEHAGALKTIEDATAIRTRILMAFEQAEREPDTEKRRVWLRFVVIGGGPTGVELAGAIAEIARDAMRDNFRSIKPEESEVLLVEGGSRVLAAFQPDLSEQAARALMRLGVRPLTGVSVTDIDGGGVRLRTPSGEQRLETHTAIWAAGVRASPLGSLLERTCGAHLDRGGRVIVNPDLSVPGRPEILVIGDMAHFEEGGKPLPGTCPVAMQQGDHVARIVRARLDESPAPSFRFADKGIMATIGRNQAVADLGFVRFGGRLAWLAWLFLHLLFLVGFRNRVVVAFQWAWQYLTFNRSARLITGEAGSVTQPKPPPPPQPPA